MSKQQKIIILFVGVAILLLLFLFFKNNGAVKNKVDSPTTAPAEKVYSYKNEDKGISIDFMDSYTEVDNNAVTFGPYITSTSSDRKIQAYKFSVVDNKSARNVLTEHSISSTTAMEPEWFVIKGLQAVEYIKKDDCEIQTIEVVGPDYNYIFSSNGCTQNRDKDSAYLKETISKINILPLSRHTNKHNIYYRDDNFGFGLGYIPSDWADYVTKKTNTGLDFGFIGKFETKDGVKDFVPAANGDFQPVLSLGIYTKADYQKLKNNKSKKIAENNFYVFTEPANLSSEDDGEFLGRRRAEVETVMLDFAAFDVNTPTASTTASASSVKK